MNAPEGLAVRAAASGKPDPRSVNVDLHCHSQVSDGVLAPAEVVRRAHANGVQIHALTDHDELGGLAEAAAEAERCGMPFVPGVEVSVTWAGETIHIVGLRIDPEDRRLAEGLARTRAGRDSRAREIAEQLERAGVPDAYEGAQRFVGNPAMIARPHFARHIVELGICASVSEVFGRFLVEGKPGYVPHRWAVLDEAVGWIRDAGGTAVLAHPGRYRIDELGLRELMTQFRDAGGTGIEVLSGSHSPGEYRRFAAFAREFGFLASRGSDFHGPTESRFDLGEMPPLPASVEPVWADWPELAIATSRG